jgi:hypothetical protein
MKKFYSTLLFSMISFFAFCGGSCTIDPSNTQFFSPSPDSIPCVERTRFYNQTIQVAVPSNLDLSAIVPGLPLPITLTVDSVVINDVQGLPTGLSYGTNPANGHFLGGTNGCVLITGTTTDIAGNYPLTLIGTITLSGLPQIPGFPLPNDTTVDLSTLSSAAPQFSLFLDVIEPDAPCRQANGISSFNNNLNSLLNVYPNPSNGVFEVRLNAGRRLNGQVLVIDVTGKTVYSENIDVIGMYVNTIDISRFAKGIYAVQVKTTEGIATKNVSVE